MTYKELLDVVAKYDDLYYGVIGSTLHIGSSSMDGPQISLSMEKVYDLKLYDLDQAPEEVLDACLALAKTPHKERGRLRVTYGSEY